MDAKFKLYDVDGNYVGTFEELVELCGMTFLEILKETDEKIKKDCYKVEEDEECPEFEIHLCRGCKHCYRHDYCYSYEKE